MRDQSKHLPCPLCGAEDGYRLEEGTTFRWWSVCCASCGHEAVEVRATNPAETTARTKPADEAWNTAGEYAERMRIGNLRYETARRMNPQQWAVAWQLNLTTGKGFDQIIDDQAAFMLSCEKAGGQA